MPQIPHTCPEDDCDYTVRTFDLYLAEITSAGIGTEYSIGNIVTGNVVDLVEFFDTFHPLGQDNEPKVSGVRTGIRISFSADEFTCRNLTYMLLVDPANVAGADRYGLDPVIEGKVFQATLEHEMPNGNLIAVRFHRAAFRAPLNWLLSPTALHSLDFELHSLPSDDHSNPFGYIQFTPGSCAVS